MGCVFFAHSLLSPAQTIVPLAIDFIIESMTRTFLFQGTLPDTVYFLVDEIHYSKQIHFKIKIKTKKKPSQTPYIEPPSHSAHPKYFHHKTVKHCMGLLFPSYVKDGLCGAIETIPHTCSPLIFHIFTCVRFFKNGKRKEQQQQRKNKQNYCSPRTIEKEFKTD